MTMRVFIKSFGCSTNLADGEVLAGCLAKAGYRFVNASSSADVVIYNTCAVKGPTEDRMIEIIKRASIGKKLIVTGCLPLINLERLREETRFDGIIGPASGDKIIEVVERVLKGEKVAILQDAAKAIPSLRLPHTPLNPLISIIPINYGCLGSCAYCCVTLARGHMRSYSIEDVVQRAREDLATGAREIWLTSQDTACYGKDRKTSLPALINTICKIEGDFAIRVGMMTPNAASDIRQELLEACQHNHVFKFLHLPVQSGDDQVLKLMRRSYSVKDFKRLVKAFRTVFPEITFATDIICGFPNESKEAFEKTLQLIDEVKPDIVNVSKFFSRPRTPAIKMLENRVPSEEIKNRSNKLAKLAKKVALERNQQWIGWTGEIIIDEVGKVSGSWVGRNFAYKPIVLRSTNKLLGKTMHVEVVKAFPTYLESKIVE
ncbi:tRNA (N(6)-L-threonylcarbamoyladenosine(37)-C(2))-methylthiotransferase [Candidatus Bathyarchaeota archaeon]|nr:tRNA (N(6)-L-threonylcarbamoyladenosine(37)-C(2))-methylthiotransferase [Candidatus Bathyarchaeota archaeon]